MNYYIQIIFTSILIPIYEYFFNNYINNSEDTRFPIKIWNHYAYLLTDIPRTNNAIEGFHNAFNCMFGTSNYSLSLLMKNIKEEEENVQQRRMRCNFGEVFVRKKKF
jgi:hypothetical protein